MRKLVRIYTLLGICLICLVLARPVGAFPPLPSSFYGTVKVNGTSVPDGTLVKALINGHVYAEAKTQTYKGDSVYSLDVLGDDSSTTAVEGGHDGETIVFTVDGKTASQTGTWKGGTNTNLNLSVSTAATQVPTTVVIPATANPENGPAGGSRNIIVIVIVVAVLILIITLWFIFVRQPKV